MNVKVNSHQQAKTGLNRVTKDLRKLLNEKGDEKNQKFLSKLSPSKASDYLLWKCTKHKINKLKEFRRTNIVMVNGPKQASRKQIYFDIIFPKCLTHSHSQNPAHDNNK